MERDPVLFAQNEKTPIIMPSICNHDPLEDTVQTMIFLTRLVGAGKNTVLNSQLLWLLFSKCYEKSSIQQFELPEH